MEKYQLLTRTLKDFMPRNLLYNDSFMSRLTEPSNLVAAAQQLRLERPELAMAGEVWAVESRVASLGIYEPYDQLSNLALEQLDLDSLAMVICCMARRENPDEFGADAWLYVYRRNLLYLRYLKRLKDLDMRQANKHIVKVSWHLVMADGPALGVYVADLQEHKAYYTKETPYAGLVAVNEIELDQQDERMIRGKLRYVRPEYWYQAPGLAGAYTVPEDVEAEGTEWKVSLVYNTGEVETITGQDERKPDRFMVLVNMFLKLDFDDIQPQMQGSEPWAPLFCTEGMH